MLEKLQEVLEVLKQARLTLKLSKCQFGKPSVEFLGQIVEKGGMRPSEVKVRSIAEFPKPKTVYEVRQFLGVSGFFRRYVPRYVIRAAPLTDLLKKQLEFEWKSEHDRAFVDLKEPLINPPILQLFDDKTPTELHTDASQKGLAAMLMQRSDEKQPLKLVYCVSKKTTDIEARYHSSKLELLAIVWAVERLRMFLLGRRFKIVTDCQALVHINAKKTSNSQIARWMTTLSEYSFEIINRHGTKMCHVDALSRSPVENAEDTEEFLMDKRLTVMTITEEDYIELIQGRRGA